jgi:hypothetical protein
MRDGPYSIGSRVDVKYRTILERKRGATTPMRRKFRKAGDALRSCGGALPVEPATIDPGRAFEGARRFWT